MKDHRRQVRRRVLKGGRILFNSKSSSIDCVVRDLSDTGALLLVENTVGIPSEFTLIMSDGRTETCVPRFKSPNKIGVEFETTSAPAREETVSPSPLKRAQHAEGILPLSEDLRQAAVRLRESGNDIDAELMERAADILSFGSESRREAWAAMSIIHEAASLLVPPGVLLSEEAINAEYGPTFGGYAQAICEALAKLR